MSEQSQAQGTEPAPPEWPQIDQAGGIHAWVYAELERQGLIDDADTSTLSDKERKRYKARREEERRVRRILMAQAWAAYRRAHLVHVGLGVFYHDTADHDRYDIVELDTRRQENDLPALADVQALANVLDLPVPRLRWLAYHREVDTGTHYHRWTVPKSDGTERLISAPKPDLKRAQRWIARSITEHLPVHGAAHGFLAGRSTVSNAAVHAGAAVVVKFDIKEFYPTVTLPRVKGLFRKAGYNEQVATVLALLCTEAPRETLELRGKKYYVALGPRSLPQGAPTSPSITNALSLRMDCRLAGLARALKLRYTRYADDLTFSWRENPFAPVGRLIGAVERIVANEGFRLNDKKTRIMRSGRRQKITGLVVNRSHRDSEIQDSESPAARVPRKLIRQIRAAIHNRENGKPGKGESLAQLRGMAAYVYMTDQKKGRTLLDRLAKLSEPSFPTPGKTGRSAPHSDDSSSEPPARSGDSSKSDDLPDDSGGPS
ncbi:MAG: reverse transcriptase family protein [Proteobacteria bacterium]|nr:reverse transcriptase family protein [Pseudomonadota bacterium]